MAKKTVQIDSDLHAKIKIACASNNMDIQEYVETCLTIFLESNMDPKQMDKMKEMRETYITFIRTGEKNFLIPIKNTVHGIHSKMDDFDFNLKAIKVKLEELLSRKA